MILRKYEIDSRQLELEQARKELEDYIKTKADKTSYTWGYFPELNDGENYSRSIRLLNTLKKRFLQSVNVQPAFVRLAISEPISDFGGFHIDVSPGIGHTKKYGDGDILRILFNIGEYPRTLEYCAVSLDKLSKKHGLEIPTDHYEAIDLPKNLIERIEIPPFANNELWMLAFKSNQVVHSGTTNEKGHFLASFGGILPEQEIARFFEPHTASK